jgi:hypothetical protein
MRAWQKENLLLLPGIEPWFQVVQPLGYSCSYLLQVSTISLYLIRQNITNYENKESLNVTVESVAYMLQILKVLGSNLSSKTGFLDRSISFFF